MSISVAYFYIFTSSLWLLINKSDYFIIMNIVTISGIKSGAVTALMRAPKDQEHKFPLNEHCNVACLHLFPFAQLKRIQTGRERERRRMKYLPLSLNFLRSRHKDSTF